MGRRYRSIQGNAFAGGVYVHDTPPPALAERLAIFRAAGRFVCRGLGGWHVVDVADVDIVQAELLTLSLEECRRRAGG